MAITVQRQLPGSFPGGMLRLGSDGLPGRGYVPANNTGQFLFLTAPEPFTGDTPDGFLAGVVMVNRDTVAVSWTLFHTRKADTLDTALDVIYKGNPGANELDWFPLYDIEPGDKLYVQVSSTTCTVYPVGPA